MRMMKRNHQNSPDQVWRESKQREVSVHVQDLQHRLSAPLVAELVLMESLSAAELVLMNVVFVETSVLEPKVSLCLALIKQKSVLLLLKLLQG